MLCDVECVCIRRDGRLPGAEKNRLEARKYTCGERGGGRDGAIARMCFFFFFKLIKDFNKDTVTPQLHSFRPSLVFLGWASTSTSRSSLFSLSLVVVIVGWMKLESALALSMRFYFGAAQQLLLILCCC